MKNQSKFVKTSALLLAFIVMAALTGCVGLSKTVRELAKDPATAHIAIRSIYVTIEIDRTAPRTNTMPHVVKDGSISVGQ